MGGLSRKIRGLNEKRTTWIEIIYFSLTLVWPKRLGHLVRGSSVKVQIVDFDSNYIKETAMLLQNAQRRQFQNIDYSHMVSLEMCEQQIDTELNKEVTSSHLLMFDNQVVGYAIATINRDTIWGDSGWVNLGAWCIKPEFAFSFPYLYQKIANVWIKEKIHQHYFMIFDADKTGLSLFCEMGFAKQQTYAVMSLSKSFDFADTTAPYVYRKSNKNDQQEMNGFSRLIANYQTQSPCFASAPRKYLEALDEGFSDITSDPDIDLFVVQDGSKLVAYQGYYDTEKPSLIIPPQSVELAVSGVKEEYRGKSCGLNMTMMGLAAQKKRGFNYAVTDWRCANLLSSSFWKKIGFLPVAHRLIRRIDPLI